MKTFNDLQFKPKTVSLRDTSGGNHAVMTFPNGYGVSVIDDGYGSSRGLYELAVLGPDGRLCYDTPITDDVLGHLSADDVTKYMAEVQILEAA